MATRLQIQKDVNGLVSFPDYEIPFTNTAWKNTVVAGVSQFVTVPEGVDIAYFAFSKANDVWVNGLGSGTMPGGLFILLEDGGQILLEDGFNLLLEASATAETGDLNPRARTVRPGQIIEITSVQDGFANILFYNREHIGISS